MTGNVAPLDARTVSIPADAYSPEFVAQLNTTGVQTTEVAAPMAAALRGTLSAVELDPVSGQRRATNRPGVMVFNGTQ